MTDPLWISLSIVAPHLPSAMHNSFGVRLVIHMFISISSTKIMQWWFPFCNSTLRTNNNLTDLFTDLIGAISTWHFVVANTLLFGVQFKWSICPFWSNRQGLFISDHFSTFWVHLPFGSSYFCVFMFKLVRANITDRNSQNKEFIHNVTNQMEQKSYTDVTNQEKFGLTLYGSEFAQLLQREFKGGFHTT